jgi:hypothetical protein
MTDMTNTTNNGTARGSSSLVPGVPMENTPVSTDALRRRFLLGREDLPARLAVSEDTLLDCRFDPATSPIIMLQDKGGASKTATAVTIARAWLAADVRYNLVDLDAQEDVENDDEPHARLLEFFPELGTNATNCMAMTLELRSEDRYAADPEEGIRQAINAAVDFATPGVVDFPANKGGFALRTLMLHRPWLDQSTQRIRQDWRMPALVVPMAPDADSIWFALSILREIEKLREVMRRDGLDPDGLKVVLVYGMAEERIGDPVANYADMSSVGHVRELQSFIKGTEWVETASIPWIRCPLWNVLKAARIDLFRAVTLGEVGLKQQFGGTLSGIDVRADLGHLARLLRIIWEQLASVGLLPVGADEIRELFSELGLRVPRTRSEQLRDKLALRSTPGGYEQWARCGTGARPGTRRSCKPWAWSLRARGQGWRRAPVGCRCLPCCRRETWHG